MSLSSSSASILPIGSRVNINRGPYTEMLKGTITDIIYIVKYDKSYQGYNKNYDYTTAFYQKKPDTENLETDLKEIIPIMPGGKRKNNRTHRSSRSRGKTVRKSRASSS